VKFDIAEPEKAIPELSRKSNLGHTFKQLSFYFKHINIVFKNMIGSFKVAEASPHIRRAGTQLGNIPWWSKNILRGQTSIWGAKIY